MWMQVELYDDEADETPVATCTVGHLARLEDLNAAIPNAIDGLQRQMARRELERRLAGFVPELCAALFPGQDVPARKQEGWFAWSEPGRPTVLVVLRSGFAGQWIDMAAGAAGGPLALIRSRLIVQGIDEEKAAEAWASDFLAEHEKGRQAELPGGAQGAAKGDGVPAQGDPPIKSGDRARSGDDGKKDGAGAAKGNGPVTGSEVSDLQRARAARAQVGGLGQPSGDDDGPAAA